MFFNPSSAGLQVTDKREDLAYSLDRILLLFTVRAYGFAHAASHYDDAQKCMRVRIDWR